MPSKIEILSKGKYRFICDTDNIDITFTRDSFREVLEGLEFSPQRIGHVVKLINKVDPLPVRPKTTPSDLAHYSETFLIDYMRKQGFNVFEKIPISNEDIIFWLNSKGHTVSEGKSPVMPSASGDYPLNDSTLFIDEDSNILP
jgi:hypothetical protein